MHYYKRNLGDYAKKAGRLSMLQHGSYTLLIDACYDREQFPTLDEAIEWTWASTDEEVEAVKFVLRKFFTLESGTYIQKRIQEEIAEYEQFCLSQKTKGSKGGRPKLEDNQIGSLNNPTGLINNPTATQQYPNETLTTNHKPLTNNHKIKNITPIAMLMAMNIPESLANDWLSVRKLKKAATTQTALDAIKKTAESAGYTFLQAVQICCERGWVGFKSEWLIDTQTREQGTTTAALTIFKPQYIAEQTGSYFTEVSNAQLN